MKIAFVIPGRFHGFDMARALTERGHDVCVLTNYPSWGTRRFGLDDDKVRRLVPHGVAARLAARVPGRWARRVTEPLLHRWFGRWAEAVLRRERWDVIHCWSGVSEELLSSSRVDAGVTLLMRGSAHIEEQSALLLAEEARSGVPLDRPSDWMIARETREYALVDQVLVLSTFTAESFWKRGVPRERVSMVPLGVDVTAFRPAASILRARQERIVNGGVLKVLYVGALSLRKGLLDFATAIEALADEPLEFRFVGPVLPEAEGVVARLHGRASFAGKLPQHDLPAEYWAADVFVFPTIEDGFPNVLAQAKGAGLPIVTTRHGAGVDIVTDGVDGWLVPVRDPVALADRLRGLAGRRAVLAAAAERAAAEARTRDWADVAADFERTCAALIERAGASRRQT